MTRVAILNSRQSKTPVGSDPWVRKTLAAVEHVATRGWGIVSSIGMNTWELVTWAAGLRRIPLTIVVPTSIDGFARADLCHRFFLNPELVTWEFVDNSKGRLSSKSWWEARDTRVAELADILLPISVRKRGRWQSLLTCPTARVDEQFRTEYDPVPHHALYPFNEFSLREEVRDWPNGWLIHWTRARNGPWPGEAEAEYYAAVAISEGLYCRSAMSTLGRIINEGRIRGASWKIGGGASVVAFTEHSPAESLALMKWRPRWSRWSIEPYGIAITREAARQLGAKPVEYVDPDAWEQIDADHRPFAHSRGISGDIWPAEREWRLLGDCDLRQLDPEHVRVIALTDSEANSLKPQCPFETFSLT